MLHRLANNQYVVAFLWYVALSLLVMAPALPVAGVAIPGGPVAETDGWQNVWNLWWVQRALATPANPLFTPLLFYPEGVDLTLQTLNIANGVLFAPVTALFGPIAAYNAALLAALALSGLGGYALAARVSGDRGASLVGGAVFAFSPFHMTKVWDGQLELITLQWIAFYALFLLRTVEDLRRRDALLAGLFLALIGYTSWYYLLFSGVYSLLFAVLWLAGAPRARRQAMAVQLGLSGAWGALLLAPFLVAAARAARSSGSGGPRFNPADPLDPILIHSANVYDLLLPNGLHPLWSDTVEKLVRTWHPYIGAWNIAPGFVALALGTIALVAARRDSWRWAILGLAATILALGPVLQIGTTRTMIPLPYQLLLAAPGMEIARRPSHFIVILTLMLAPLVALGLRALRARVQPHHGQILAGAAAVLIAAEYFPPAWPLHTLAVHPYYARIAGEPGAVLELPPHTESSEPLKAQMIHGQPLLGGFVSRRPAYPFASRAPGVRQLWAMRPEESRLFAGGPDDGLLALQAYSIRHILVYWNEIDPGHRANLRAALLQTLGDVAPVYADQQLSAYAVPPVEPRPFAYAAFGDGWHPEEADGPRRWRWMGAQGDLVLVNPSRRDLPILLSLHVQPFAEERMMAAAFDRQPLGEFVVRAEGATFTFRLLLPPGEHVLRLVAPAASDPGLSGRLISIVALDAQIRVTP